MRHTQHRAFLGVVLRRWRLIAAVAVPVFAAVAVMTYVAPPEYEASARVSIETNEAATGDVFEAASKLLRSRAFARLMIQKLDLLGEAEFGGPRTWERMKAALAAPAGQNAEVEAAIDRFLSRLDVGRDRKARILAVRYTANRPGLAAAVANAVAITLVEQPPAKARVVEAATTPTQPVRRRKLRDLALGALVGLLLGVGLAFWAESRGSRRDRTLRMPEDVRIQLAAPLLAVVPRLDGDDPGVRVLLDPDRAGGFAASYRVLGTALGSAWPDAAPRVVLVTSAAPGEGKTLTAVNLALALAAAGENVIVIDADLRHPQAHTLLRARRSPGLSDVLVGRARPSEAIQVRLDSAPIAFLPAGTASLGRGILGAATARTFLDGLRRFYRWVIVDAPPSTAVEKPLTLAPLADAVLLVAAAGTTARNDAALTLARVDTAGGRTLGVVLNRARIETQS